MWARLVGPGSFGMNKPCVVPGKIDTKSMDVVDMIAGLSYISPWPAPIALSTNWPANLGLRRRDTTAEGGSELGANIVVGRSLDIGAQWHCQDSGELPPPSI